MLFFQFINIYLHMTAKTNLGSPNKTFVRNDYDSNSITWPSTFRVRVGRTIPDGHPGLQSPSGRQTRPVHQKYSYLMTIWPHSPLTVETAGFSTTSEPQPNLTWWWYTFVPCHPREEERCQHDDDRDDDGCNHCCSVRFSCGIINPCLPTQQKPDKCAGACYQ